MRTSRRYWLVAFVMGLFLSFASAKTSDLDPTTIIYTPPDRIAWKTGANGLQSAVLLGDPSKPGLYVQLLKRPAHDWSRPHWHPNDRVITVLSGTFWVGTGAKFDPDNSVPIPAGGFITQFGKQVHFDGTKDDTVTLEIVGEGPATSTPAEEK